MFHSEPNKWEIFEIPPVQPIHYYSILERKREFSELIKQYDAQMHKHGCLHYCSIVPKSIISSLNDEYELLILFLEDVPSTSFIGFRIIVNSETFIHESNSLLLFLKQSKKAGLYFVNNKCILVQCGKVAWEIFYHLYGIYLRKLVLTNIGTQFFNHFIYQICFQNEKQLLNMLFKGSKVIRVSKMSIYYRIHQKRKISVTDLIQMTLNMPKSKRCVILFDSKESLCYSNILDPNIYTTTGCKIHVSKLVINKFKKEYQDSLPNNNYTEEIPLENVSSLVLNLHSKFESPEFKAHKADIENKQLIANSSVQKRKFEETENDLEKDTFFHKFSKISGLNCLKEENYWKQYASLKPYPMMSYLSLLPSKSMIPDIFDNSRSSCKVDSLNNVYCNNFFTVHDDKSSSAFLKKCQNSPTVEEACDIYNVKNFSRDSPFDGNCMNATCFRGEKIMNNCKKNTYSTNDYSESVPSTQMHHQKNLSLQNVSFSKSSSALSPSKHTDQDEANDIFTTAAGKIINISSNAMLAAHRFIQGMFQHETHQKSDRDAHCNPAKNEQFINMSTLKKNSVISYAARSSNDDEITSGDIDSKSINNNYEPGVSYNRDIVSFSTAAGKTINVSKAAMKTAHKILLKDAFEKKDRIIPSTSVTSNTRKKKQAFNDICCPPKKLLIGYNDDTMDKTLVEQLFQDAVFDEKESEDITQYSQDKDFDKVLGSKKNNDPTTCKTRKSLGGRRSKRFFSST